MAMRFSVFFCCGIVFSIIVFILSFYHGFWRLLLEGFFFFALLRCLSETFWISLTCCNVNKTILLLLLFKMDFPPQSSAVARMKDQTVPVLAGGCESLFWRSTAWPEDRRTDGRRSEVAHRSLTLMERWQSEDGRMILDIWLSTHQNRCKKWH